MDTRNKDSPLVYISAFYGRFDGIEKVQYLLLQKAKKNRKFPK